MFPISSAHSFQRIEFYIFRPFGVYPCPFLDLWTQTRSTVLFYARSKPMMGKKAAKCKTISDENGRKIALNLRFVLTTCLRE